MTYSFKKILSLLLALTLLAGVMAGCKKDDAGETTPTGEANTPPGLVEVNPSESTEPTGTEPTEEDKQLDENTAVVKEQMNVRSAPSSDSSIIGHLDKGTQVQILRRETVGGIEWALIREGWIALENVELGATADPDDVGTGNVDDPDATEPEDNKDNENTPVGTTKGIITASQLNIRKEPLANAKIVGNYVKGDAVTILETKNGFGRTDKGWISMDYVNTGNKTNTGTTTNNNNTNGTKGTITATQLNIRKEADKNSASVGSYKKGDTVTILETKNGWGRTDKGWISMTYVNTGANTNTNTNTNTTNIKGIVVANELNIRKSADKNSDKVGSYTYGTRVTILEKSNGWGRTDKGWIAMNYVYQDGTQGTNGCKGVSTGNKVNLRSGPGTNYGSNGSVNYGDRLNILQRITVGGKEWGCTKKGWVCMDYVYVDGTQGTGAGSATVTGNKVNIRSGPGTGYASNGSVNEGDTIMIYNQMDIGGKTWGCTDKGWICMDYAKLNG